MAMRSKPNPAVVAYTLSERELVRFLRQPNRVFGALGQPIIFWLLFSQGFSGLESSQLDARFFFPGTLVMILLFTAIFSTISIIEDRREGFLQSVLVAPIPRWSMVLGKVLGGTALALLQGLLFLALGWLTLGIRLGLVAMAAAVAMIALVSFALTALGFLIAWRMDSTQGFHAIMSVLLLPMWLLSGAFFPGEAGWLGWIVRINPLSYGVYGLRRILQFDDVAAAPSLAICWLVTLAFAAITFMLATRIAAKRTTGDLL